jgi:drug/metabolite transporter (DMT)-like permease
MLLWFYGLSVVPIAEATALSFTSVLFASLGAVLFLSERMGIRRWSALAVGFVGALLMLRPGAEALQLGSVVVLLAAFTWGTSLCMLKVLTRSDSTTTLVAWMGLMTTAITAVPAVLVWQSPTLAQLGWLVLIGSLGTLGTFAFTHALRVADTTLVLPTDFTRLVWATLLGYALFGEIPDGWTWAGGLLVVASTAYIALREAQLSQRAAPPRR